MLESTYTFLAIIGILCGFITWVYHSIHKVTRIEKGIRLAALFLKEKTHEDKENLAESVQNKFPNSATKITSFKYLGNYEPTGNLFGTITKQGRYIHSIKVVGSILLLVAVFTLLFSVFNLLILEEYFGLSSIDNVDVENIRVIIFTMSIIPACVSIIFVGAFYIFLVNKKMDFYRDALNQTKVIENRDWIDDIVSAENHSILQNVWNSSNKPWN